LASASIRSAEKPSKVVGTSAVSAPNSGTGVCNLYNFANGYQVATYQKADGSTQWLESFLLRQNGYLRTPERRVWLSWGWSYEFPVEIEGSRHYTLEPFSKLDVYENPANIFFEGPSRLINDDTGETVGVAVTESMDVRIMQNAPYAATSIEAETMLKVLGANKKEITMADKKPL
jgi:hypothetical protein